MYKFYVESTFYFDNIDERNIFSTKKLLLNHTNMKIIDLPKKFQRLIFDEI
jgi:hypothetical protein